MGDTRIPTRLDEPARILMWDASQVGLLVAFVFLGILLKDPITWIAAGLALAHVLGKFTGGRHRRFLPDKARNQRLTRRQGGDIRLMQPAPPGNCGNSFPPL